MPCLCLCPSPHSLVKAVPHHRDPQAELMNQKKAFLILSLLSYDKKTQVHIQNLTSLPWVCGWSTEYPQGLLSPGASGVLLPGPRQSHHGPGMVFQAFIEPWKTLFVAFYCLLVVGRGTRFLSHDGRAKQHHGQFGWASWGLSSWTLGQEAELCQSGCR